MKRRANLAVLPVVVAIWWSAQISDAAGPSDDPITGDVYREAVQVRVVNVDVRVSDKKGRPVMDLLAADFEILEDGKPMEISNFALVKGRTRAGSSLSEASGGGFSEPASMGREPFWLVVYFDQLQTRQADRNRLMRQIRSFLDTEIGSGAEIMIASFDRSLRIHQGFTTERPAVSRALEEVEAVPCTGVRFQTNRSALLEIVDTASHSVYAVNTLKPYIHSVGSDLGMTLRGLEEMLNLLAGLPGRKEILYVASGLPRVLGGGSCC